MKAKVLSAILCTLTVVAVMATPASVHAADLVDSTASSADDETSGVDVTQGVSTTYGTSAEIKSTTYTQDEKTMVYATKTSSVVITVPRVLVVGKDEASDSNAYKGTFNVKVSGDIAGSQSVEITPRVGNDFVEVNGKESDTSAEVLLDGKPKYTIGANSLLHGAEVVIPGSISVDGITSGSWKGDISFHINLTNSIN